MPKNESFFGAVRRFFADYLDAMGNRGAFGRLVRLASEDSALRERLLNDPDAVLAEEGIKLPEGMHVKFLENTDGVVHLVLPPLVENGEGGEQ